MVIRTMRLCTKPSATAISVRAWNITCRCFLKRVGTLFDYIGEEALFVSLGDVHAEANRFWSDVKSRYAMVQGDETIRLCFHSICISLLMFCQAV